jgi:hypothetical protein
MLYSDIDPENKADVTIKNYLTVLGRELSDLIDVNCIRIIKGEFREQKEDNYIHAIYSVQYKKNTNLIIHVQAHTILSFNPADPEISVYLRETSNHINNQTSKPKKLQPIKQLLSKDTYGEYPLQVAILIMVKYNQFCNCEK